MTFYALYMMCFYCLAGVWGPVLVTSSMSRMFLGYLSRGSMPPAFISFQFPKCAVAPGPKFAHAHWGRRGERLCVRFGLF